MSQAALALPELSDSYISLIESGKRIPAPAVIEILAQKLSCSASYLATGVSEETLSELREKLQYAEIALQNGEADEARDGFAEVLRHPHVDIPPGMREDARFGHAQALEASGALDDAIEELKRIVSKLTPESQPDRWAEVHIALSRCYRELADLPASVEVAETAFSRLTAGGGRWTDSVVKLGSTLLGAYGHRGDLVRAKHMSAHLIERAEAVGSPTALMAAFWNAAFVAELHYDFDKALTYARRAIALLGEEEDPRNLSRLRMAYGHFLLMAHPEEAGTAKEVLEKAYEQISASAASSVDLAWCLTQRARAEIVLERAEEAVSLVEQAMTLLDGAPVHVSAEALTMLGWAYLQLDRREEAVKVFTNAATLLEDMKASRTAAQLWFSLAELLAGLGRSDQHTVAYQRALTCVGI